MDSAKYLLCGIIVGAALAKVVAHFLFWRDMDR